MEVSVKLFPIAVPVLLLLVTIAGSAQVERLELRKLRAESLVKASRYDEGIAGYQAILQEHPLTPKEKGELYVFIGEAYALNGQLESAVENLKKAIELDQGNPTYAHILAQCFAIAGYSEEAMVYYKKALGWDPENAALMNNAAWFISQNGGDLDEALRLAQTAVRKKPDWDEVHDTLGWIYLKKHETGRAVSVFQKLVEKQRTNAAYHYHYALALAQSGDKTAALNHLDLALSNEPDEELELQIHAMIRTLS